MGKKSYYNIIEMENEYMTKKMVCEWLKISLSTLHRLQREGLPYYKFRHTTRYRMADIEKWFRKYCRRKGGN